MKEEMVLLCSPTEKGAWESDKRKHVVGNNRYQKKKL